MKITYSKIFALIQLLLSVLTTIYLKDNSVFLTAMPLCTAIIVGKQYNDRKKTETNAEVVG